MCKKVTYRIIAALLFAVMCVAAIPFTAFTVVGEGIDAALLQNPGALVGNIATLNIEDWANYHICDKPEAYDDAFWDDESYWIYNEELGEDEIPDDDMELVITNYYYDSEREYLWYSVKAAPGYELPEKLKYKPYILHVDGSDVPVSLYISDCGKNYVFDQNGNAVTEATMSYYETLTFCSKSSLQGKVSYKWQIYAEDIWVDIYGEEEADIDVNIGMLSSVLKDNTASVRCVSESGAKALPGDAITITINEERRTVSDSDAMYSAVHYNLAQAALDEECYVTIKYLFEDGVTEAANPDIAQLTKGTEFTATFEFPKVQGYLPYYNEEQVDSLSLTGVTVTDDITYTVIYRPTDVEYQIAVYFQNIEDDGYTFQSVETLTGLTGSLVPHKTITYEGMYELLHDTPQIAANGSTRVEVYYNRTYYLTRFDLDGGYGVYSMYARYGDDLASKIGMPIKPGYTFIGWDEITNGAGDGIADTIPDTVPAENHVYKALWKMEENAKVRIVYWGENPNDEEYAYLESKELYVEPGKVLTFNSGEFVCDLEEHIHDGSCVTVCGKVEEEHSESCYGNCTLAGHVHTADCYDNVGDRDDPLDAPDNPVDGQIYIYRRNNRYIYIGGYWYRYNRNESSGTIIEPNASCAKRNHEHTVACLNCIHHTHIANCYECIQHQHTAVCYLSSTLDSDLWTFVKSDTVTVAADGSTVMNVYFDRTTFTMTFKETGGNRDTLDAITEKWGADIKERFETISEEHTFLWSRTNDGNSPWTSFVDIMPQENRIYYANITSSTNEQTAKYYGLKVGGTAGNKADYEVLYTVTVKYSNNLTVSEEEFEEIEGYTFNDPLSTNEGDAYNGAEFYYDRANYKLEFHNGNDLIREEYVPYEQFLTQYKGYEPTLPDVYEPGSRKFVGWYLNPECTGEPVDLANMKMPAENIALYAKWELVYHTVNIYKEKKDDGTFGDSVLLEELTPVLHGHKVFETDYEIARPENAPYEFVGWFYMEGDEERMWDFEHSVVVRDTDIYAKWSAEVLVPYKIRFIVKKTDGTETEIGDSVSGSSLAGTTVTFHAKAGNELYTLYQHGYFPVTTSHSMTMDVDMADEGMTYDFVYVPKESVEYTVRYVDEGGNDLFPEETESSTYAIVTKKFKYKEGYMPDAYQKTLILDGTEGAKNEIVFYYKKSTTQSVYIVTHYIQSTDGEYYTEYSSYGDIGTIGDVVKITPLEMNGFKFDHACVNGTDVSFTAEGTINGTVTKEGLEIELYYNRNKYPYVIQYLDKDTLKVLEEAVTVKPGEYFGKVVTEEDPPVITNYQLSSVSSCVITVDDLEKPVKNIVKVYYSEKTIKINYEVVGTEGCGTVTPAFTEVKVLSGKGAASTAAANKGFRFEGWYEDEACTQPVTDKEMLNLVIPDDGVWTEKTYYAKFVCDTGDLTIVRNNAESDDQVFVYMVTNTETGESVTVTVVGNGSVTIHELPFGQYKITQQNDWSWRYGDDAAVVSHEYAEGSETTVTFVDSQRADKKQWLNGNSPLIQNQRG